MARTQTDLDIAYLVKKFGRSERQRIKTIYLRTYSVYSRIAPLAHFAHVFALDQVEKEMKNNK